MRNTDFDPDFVCQLLQVLLEDIVTGAIAPAAIT